MLFRSALTPFANSLIWVLSFDRQCRCNTLTCTSRSRRCVHRRVHSFNTAVTWMHAYRIRDRRRRLTHGVIRIRPSMKLTGVELRWVWPQCWRVHGRVVGSAIGLHVGWYIHGQLADTILITNRMNGLSVRWLEWRRQWHPEALWLPHRWQQRR